MRVEPQQLRAFLLDAGLVNEAQFSDVDKKAKKTHKRIEDVLVSEGLISETEILRLKAYILGIPFVNLEKEKISNEILRIIPEPIARSHNIIAFRKKVNL